jgi:2'-5' RNA ligase
LLGLLECSRQSFGHRAVSLEVMIAGRILPCHGELVWSTDRRTTSVTRRAIVIFPALPEEPIASLRRLYDPLAGSVPPHLTLVFPFESALTGDDLRRHVADCVRDIAPFPVSLAGITGSEGEYLFLNVKRGNDELIALHDRLYTGILSQYRSLAHTYLPHLTVGRLDDTASFQRALANVALLDVPLTTEVTAVTVYRLEPSGSRPVESSVRLGAAESGAGTA